MQPQREPDWHSVREAFSDSLKQIETKIREDPSNDGYLLTRDLFRASIEMCDARIAGDDTKLKDAVERIAEINRTISGLSEFGSGSRGNA